MHAFRRNFAETTPIAARPWSWVALVSSLLLSAYGCEVEQPHCVPGQSIACAGAGCTGHQVCQADGRAYAPCVCGSDNGEFPAAGPNSGLIGAACSDVSSCRTGLECIGADSTMLGGEGPSAGMCLARCLPDHDFCKGLDAMSKCIVLDDGGTANDALDDIAYCLPGCTLGSQANELDKCRGRIDLVCSESPIGSKVGYCRPACRSDVDCGERFCDLGTGLCGDSARSGDPIGALCSAVGANSTCAGGCMTWGPAYAECSGVCSYGSAGCGQAGDGRLQSYCFHAPTVGTGDGDLGYCAKLCDCDADCGRSDAVCEPQASLAVTTGRAGVCGSRSLPSGAARKSHPCP